MKNLSDKELYAKCVECSFMIRKYRNQFIGLLPEVNARQLYLKHNMHSIYEFAAKFGYLNKETVDRVLNLKAKLKDKPILNKMLESGEVGWSKLEVANKLVNSIQTENEITKILPTISYASLVTMVKDNSNFGTESILVKSEEKYSDNFETFSIKLKTETLAQLKVIKYKLEKQTKQPLTWETAMELMIEKLNAPIKENKKTIPTERKDKQLERTSRYVSAAKKRETLQKTNQLCANPNCNKPAEHLHHQNPYIISKNHESLIPLCKAHHDLVHHNENNYVNNKYQQYKSLALRL